MTDVYHALTGALKRKGRADIIPSAPTVRPTGTGYVRYEDLYVTGNTLRQVLAKVTGNQILTFPEGDFTFSDFADPNGFYDGLRVPNTCGGLWGSGANTVFRMLPGTSTRANNTEAVGATTGDTNNCFLIAMVGATNSPTFRNFSLIGTNQGHSYNGLHLRFCDNAVVDGLRVIGANPGFANYPPGETFGINIDRCNSTSLLNTEVDGRDATSGARVGASPVGWDNCVDAYSANLYAHHAKTGMPTFYQTQNVHTVNLRSEYNGSSTGILSGAGINHENVTGTILHESPTLILDRANGNSGLHVYFNNGISNTTSITLTGVTHDAGPNTLFSVMIDDAYVDPSGRAQKQTTLPTVTKAGVTLTARDTAVGVSSPLDASQYFRYH